MLLSAYTAVHVAISLIGILSGLVVVYGMISNKRLNGWTWIFLVTTLLTNVTGFFFPLQRHYSGDHRRDPLAAGAGRSLCRALPARSCGRLASDVCCERYRRSLLQRFRSGCAAL